MAHDSWRLKFQKPILTDCNSIRESEELYTHLFVAHLRLGDFNAMKLTAMKLNQKYKKFQYLAWWVMCSYHQAAVLDENKAINLRLARKYLESVKGDHGEGAYKLYLLILLELGDIDALEEREYLIEMKIVLFFFYL